MKARSWFVASMAVVIAFLGSAAAGCAPQGTPSPPSAEKNLSVMVSILPQAYFCERIGGAYVDVSVVVPPGGNPHTYEPKPAQMEVLSKADAYMSIGVSFENAWMDRIRSANSEMLVVDTSQGIDRMPITAGHADEGENLDPHIWTSPALVKIQAQTIYDALVQLDPEHQAAFRANLDAFLADIDALESSIRASLAGIKSKRFMVFHPSWGYFARDFDLEMIAIEIEGKEPSASEMAQVIAEAKANGIKVIFAQPEFSSRSAEAIAAEIGGKVLLISPLAYDWLDNLKQVAKTFAQVLGDS